MQVHGTIHKIRKVRGSPVVDLAASQHGIDKINCNFSKDHMAQLATLLVGQKVVIQGRGGRFLMNVQLKECQLVQ